MNIKQSWDVNSLGTAAGKKLPLIHKTGISNSTKLQAFSISSLFPLDFTVIICFPVHFFFLFQMENFCDDFTYDALLWTHLFLQNVGLNIFLVTFTFYTTAANRTKFTLYSICFWELFRSRKCEGIGWFLKVTIQTQTLVGTIGISVTSNSYMLLLIRITTKHQFWVPSLYKDIQLSHCLLFSAHTN
jgi:hypothetical protein